MTTNKALTSRSVIDRIIRCNAIAGRAAWIQNDRPKALGSGHDVERGSARRPARFICPDRRLTGYGLGDRLTEEIDTLASAALSKRITEYCCEDAA